MIKKNWWRRSLNSHSRLLQAMSARAVEQRRRIEEKRIKAQKKRTMEQQEKAFEGVREARMRGEAITGMDIMERKKTSKELMWRAKWNTRRAKFNARARKYS